MKKLSEKQILTTFAQKVRELRELRGLTQEQLAEAAGISKNAVTLIELEQRAPRINTVVALAYGLGVEPSELLRFSISTENLRTVAEPSAPYENGLNPQEIADLILAYGNAESSLRASIRRQLGLEKSDQDREAFERHALSYREQRDKLQIKDRKGE